MSAPLSVSEMFDGKLRQARKGARERVKEAQKLLRRAGKGVGDEVHAEVRKATAEAAEAMRGKDVAQIQRSSDALGALVDQRLDTFRKPAWRESIESIVVAVLVALLLRSFVLEAFKIPSGSMIPTLAIGDQIFVNKFLYGVRIPFTSVRLVEFAAPKRGEVIVFISPVPPHEDFIKRVVAIAGDQIEVRNGLVLVNGEPVRRDGKGRGTYWDRDGATERWYPFEAIGFQEHHGEHDYVVLDDTESNIPQANFGPVVVPEGNVFVMGDNRDHSYDSRSWGPVPMPNILGRAMFVWWSWGKDGLDVGRLGTWID
jgi:signal peptidase I